MKRVELYGRVLDSEFSDALFGQINESSSPLNLLIGSKRFVEGWDCWRVSTLGLMHVGKSEGSQIIQLFGRGVRLKGHDWSLQRSGFATPTSQPEFIQYTETLNVFGVEADFMERFRDFLEEEELPSNDKKEIVQIMSCIGLVCSPTMALATFRDSLLNIWKTKA